MTQPQPSNADILTAIQQLIAAINGLREDLNPPAPGPARGLSTNIRNSPDHRHRTGHRMGFGPTYVELEEGLT
jgi:hypothetical protein